MDLSSSSSEDHGAGVVKNKKIEETTDQRPTKKKTTTTPVAATAVVTKNLGAARPPPPSSGNDREEEHHPASSSSSSSQRRRSSQQYSSTSTSSTAAGFQDSDDSFPFRLHRLLQDATNYGFSTIVSWILDGTAFMVHDRDQFIRQIMPKYFSQSQFKSFQVRPPSAAAIVLPSQFSSWCPKLSVAWFVLVGACCLTNRSSSSPFSL